MDMYMCMYVCGLFIETPCVLCGVAAEVLLYDDAGTLESLARYQVPGRYELMGYMYCHTMVPHSITGILSGKRRENEGGRGRRATSEGPGTDRVKIAISCSAGSRVRTHVQDAANEAICITGARLFWSTRL
jgi:hypothetical protein